jgi:excisionase family DNA binding protein
MTALEKPLPPPCVLLVDPHPPPRLRRGRLQAAYALVPDREPDRAPALTRDGREVFGSGILRGARPRSLPGGEVGVEDNNRKNVTVAEAAEYLGLSRSTVQEMVDRGVLEAERFAGAVHIPREEVERIERESAP